MGAHHWTDQIGIIIGNHHAGLKLGHSDAGREGRSGLVFPDGSESTSFDGSDDLWWCSRQRLCGVARLKGI